MIINLYTYKGSKQSLIGPWVTAGYLLDHDKDFSHRIPYVKDIFKKRKSITKFDDILKDKLFIVTSEAEDINTDGDLCAYYAESKIIRSARAYEPSITINRISNPKLWYEKLTVIAAVFYRTEKLRRRSIDQDLLSLETDTDRHLELLLSYRHLPPYYLWDKTIELVKNINPKPRWWHSEIKSLENILYDDIN